MINYSSSLPQLISPLENKKQINIQFLRAFAALLVVFYHTADHFFVTGGSQSGNIFTHLSGEEPNNINVLCVFGQALLKLKHAGIYGVLFQNLTNHFNFL